MDFQVEPLIGAGMEPLEAHALQLAVERFDSFAMVLQVQFIDPVVRLHIDFANRHQAHPGVGLNRSFIIRAIEGFIAQGFSSLRQAKEQFLHRG